MAGRIEFEIRGMDHVIHTLEQLPREVTTRRGGLAAKALRKGALIIRDQARANVRAITAGSTRSTGALAKAVTASKVRLRGEKGARYLVWLGKRSARRYRQSAANVRSGRSGRTYAIEGPQFYGRFLEYGTAKMIARPWIRPAFQTRRVEAVSITNREMLDLVDDAAQRFLNGGL